MAVVSLDTVLNGSFIRRFQGLASGASRYANPLQGGGNVTLSEGLRLGARTFATAVQGLNATISFVNISRNTLEQLKKTVGQMVDLAEEASERGVGSDTRNNLDLSFRKLVEKFRDIVENSKIGRDDYLTKDGLTAILRKIGLDRATSLSVSRLFDAFATPPSEDKLASERTKAGRPLSIPESVFDAGRSKIPYRLKQITQSDGDLPTSQFDQSGIAPTTSIFLNVDSSSGANPGERAVFFVDQNGTVTSQPAGTLSGSEDIVQVMAVNEISIDGTSVPGYAIVRSTGDLFGGFNPDGVEQLFLVNSTGQVVHQITANSTVDNFSYKGADLSHDGLTFVVSVSNGVDSTVIQSLRFGALGGNPELATEKTITSIGPADPWEVGDVQLSPDGNYALVKEPNGNFYQLYQYDEAGPAWNVHGGDGNGGIIANGIRAAFVAGDDGRVVFAVPGELGGFTIRTLDFANTNAVTVTGATFSGNFEELAALSYNTQSATTGYFAVIEDATLRMFTLNAAGTEMTEVDLNASTSALGYALGQASVTNLSLAQRPDGYVDIGILGKIGATGDEDNELYRLIFNTQSLSGRRQGFATEEPTKILDYRLTTRPDAYRALQDLKKLSEQIDKNLKALDKMTTYIGQSLDFIRATGLAFLDASERLANESDADKVAQDLRIQIRRNARGSLAQAENLESIVVAALTFGQE
jgi:hypothetical protein